METINDRFKIIVERWFRGNNLAFARSMGKYSSSFSKIINGTVDPRASTLQEVCKSIPELNPTWLLLGCGEMLCDAKKSVVCDNGNNLAESINQKNAEIRAKDELIKVLKEQVEDLREFVRLLRESR